MSALSSKQVEAAQEFVRITLDTLETERGVHAETAVAGIARMAGTFLFRSFDFPLKDLKPGQPVLSEQANEMGPELVTLLSGVLEDSGITPDMGKLNVPHPENEPMLTFLETQAQLEPMFEKTRERLGLSFEEAAHAAAAGTALLIQQCAEVLDPDVAVEIAIFGFVEGSKTVPAPIAF